MTAKQKLTVLAIVDDFVFGHALCQAASEKPVNMDFAAAQMAEGHFPKITEIFGGVRIEIGKDRFR